MASSGIPTYEKSFSQSQAVNFISQTIQTLRRMENSSDYETLKTILGHLSQSYFDLRTHREAMLNEMLNNGYVACISGYLEKFKRVGYFGDNGLSKSTESALNGLWNFSDGSQNIANEILKTEMPSHLISIVLEFGKDDLKNSEIDFIVKSSISIIQNIIRIPGNEGPFKTDEFKLTLVKLIQGNHSDFMNIVSMITLAILVNENELSLLEDGENTIRTLITEIQTGFEREDKRVSGFAIWELINGLRCASANDNMKKIIAKEGGLKLIIDILKKPSCEDEIEKSLGVIWNLCFDKEIRTILVNNFDLRNVVKTHESHSSSTIRKSCEGILWLIDDKAQSNKRIKSASISRTTALKDKWKFDVFLSYSWANKPMVLSIREELRKSNINVWIDVDQMKGSTLEAMADGIENSQIFVMAVSDAYRTSANCRTEVEYAFHLKKPIVPLIVELKYKPTSWLGLIIGSKMYYEFSERRDYNESFNGLLENIKTIQSRD